MVEGSRSSRAASMCGNPIVIRSLAAAVADGEAAGDVEATGNGEATGDVEALTRADGDTATLGVDVATEPPHAATRLATAMAAQRRDFVVMKGRLIDSPIRHT
jgi:hypothetical protein